MSFIDISIAGSSGGRQGGAALLVERVIPARATPSAEAVIAAAPVVEADATRIVVQSDSRSKPQPTPKQVLLGTASFLAALYLIGWLGIIKIA